MQVKGHHAGVYAWGEAGPLVHTIPCTVLMLVISNYTSVASRKEISPSLSQSPKLK